MLLISSGFKLQKRQEIHIFSDENTECKSRHLKILLKSLPSYLCVYICISIDMISSKCYAHSYRKPEINIPGVHMALIFVFSSI